jgi:hypothetical protein
VSIIDIVVPENDVDIDTFGDVSPFHVESIIVFGVPESENSMFKRGGVRLRASEELCDG